MTIMSYESFKQLVIRNIKDYLPEKYEKWEIRESIVRKINENMDCINILPKEEDAVQGIYPNIYLNFFYKKMKEGLSFEYIMQAIAVLIDGATPPIEIKDMNNMLEEIIPTIINREGNEKLIESLPHRKFLDLAVIYRIAVATEDSGVYGCNVNYDILDGMELNEDELYDLALKNMQRKFPLKIRNLGTHMKKIMGEDEGIRNINEWSPLFIISNEEHFFGASAILYDEILKKVADVMDENLYILPASIHEILVTPKSLCEKEKLKSTLMQVNSQTLSRNEWLSDNIYEYDRQSNTIEISGQI